MKKTPLHFFSASFLAILSSLIPTIVSAQIKLPVDYNLILASERTVLLTKNLKIINKILHVTTLDAQLKMDGLTIAGKM